MKKIKLAIFINLFIFSYCLNAQMVNVNRWVSPVTRDFTSIPENMSTDAQLANAGYTSKIFQYRAYATRPADIDIIAVNRWEMGSCREFIILAEHEGTDQQFISWGYKNKQLLFYAYRTRPRTGSFVAVNRWVNTLPQGNNCRDFTLSVADHELTDAQLTSWGYTNKLVQFYVPDPRSGGVTPTPVNLNCVTVYDQPNYQGRSQSMCDAGSFTAPFPIRSIRIPTGYVVNVLANPGQEFASDWSSDLNNTDIRQNDPIRIVTTPRARQLEITLLQVNSNIHNGDCTRFYGTVSASVRLNSGASNLGSANLINWARGPVRNIPNYSASDVRNLENARFVVRVDENMLNQCTFSVNTNLGSAHKGCDLCTDFTWEAKMPQERLFTLNLASALSQGTVVVGPYGASDNRHEIRVKFQVRRL
jgi:hypothetical protein